jgi:hypothetical protein
MLKLRDQTIEQKDKALQVVNALLSQLGRDLADEIEQKKELMEMLDRVIPDLPSYHTVPSWYEEFKHKHINTQTDE